MTDKFNYGITNKFGVRVGDILPTNMSGEIEVLDIVNSKDVTIKFLKTGNVRKCAMQPLACGQVKDKVYGVGFVQGAPTKEDGVWRKS